MLKNRIIEWLKRYIPAEIVAIICALAGSAIGFYVLGSKITGALLGAWGENLSYYTFLTIREIRNHRKAHHAQGKKYGFRGFFRTMFHLLLEFGPAETLDSFFFRPLFMYIFPLLLNNFTLGIIVGKFAADFTFYVPAIISYELKKKYLKD